MTCHLMEHGELKILTLNYMTKHIAISIIAVVARINANTARKKALDGKNYLNISIPTKSNTKVFARR